VVWGATTIVGVVAGAYWVWDAARRRRLGVDVIAVLAQLGTLAVGEEFAGAVITVMLGTGRLLEALASARADRDLTILMARVPQSVHRRTGDTLTQPPLDDVVPGDVLVVFPGEVVPADGLIEGAAALLDESALTGEPLPVERCAGDPVRSGTVNAGDSFDIRVNASAADSTYAGVVRMMELARSESAPFVRMADRWAGWFLAASAVTAGAAWLMSGDAIRAVAVLVVATPCPLILAAPVAVVSGLSRAARAGVIIKGGGALERLAAGRILLLDKTGTLTNGRPTVVEIMTDGTVASEEVLSLAASLDQISPHVLAGAIVRAARDRGLSLTLPTDVEEVPAHGVRGLVGDRRVAVGKGSWIVPPGPAPRWVRSVQRRAELDGALSMFVEIDGRAVGAVVLEDPVRADAPRTIRRLRASGIRRVVMVTGDRSDVAQTVEAVIGVDEVLAERTPAEKVEAVTFEARSGSTIMVGDGINDAPALAQADVGVAIGARGSTASSEAADVVLTVDRLERLAYGIDVARRTQVIARQSVTAGIGLSVVAVGLEDVGLLPVVWGALLQEVIDVAVILNALRALGSGRGASVGQFDAAGAALVRRFTAEHQSLRPDLDRLRVVADGLGSEPVGESVAALHSLQDFLVNELLPHEEAEDRALYPAVAAVLGGTDPTGAMSRTHVEIAHLVRRLGRLLDEMPSSGPDEDDLAEFRRLLYGLNAILRLHFAQEDEGYLSLGDVSMSEPADRALDDDPEPSQCVGPSALLPAAARAQDAER